MQELEKILEEIQELRGKAGSECTSEDHYIKKAWELCLDQVTEIIRRHMNDGWISVEERLPEEGQKVWISIKTDCVRWGMYIKRFGFGMREGFICSDGFADINAVNAWKPYIIPDPYCPERRDNHDRE